MDTNNDGVISRAKLLLESGAPFAMLEMQEAPQEAAVRALADLHLDADKGLTTTPARRHSPGAKDRRPLCGPCARQASIVSPPGRALERLHDADQLNAGTAEGRSSYAPVRAAPGHLQCRLEPTASRSSTPR